MEKKFYDGHKLKKGKFITPLNQMEQLTLSSWARERIPEYLWLSLIIAEFGHKKGIELCCECIKELHYLDGNIFLPKWSIIIKMNDEKQYAFYKKFFDLKLEKIVAPLLVLFTYSNAPLFARVFSNLEFNIKEFMKKIENSLELANDYQSEFSTDVRFCVVFSEFGRMQIQGNMSENFQNLKDYPNLDHTNETMHMLRSLIRSMEIALNEPKNIDYLNEFWNKVGKMTDCSLFFVDIPKENIETQDYIMKVKSVLAYHSDLMLATKPTDQKYTVLLGLSTYAYKRLIEVVEHDLFQSISGRSCVRSIVECSIMMKYLLDEEGNHNNIWEDYQYYGLGQYKLIVERANSTNIDLSKSHVMIDYLDILVSEFRKKDFIDMDTKYFDKKNIRLKAEQVGEKDLFDYLYDYDSAFEHALWGAVRESSLLKCDEVGHNYHCVPDLDNKIELKSVWTDCCYVMNKIIGILNNEYGCPNHLLIV